MKVVVDNAKNLFDKFEDKLEQWAKILF